MLPPIVVGTPAVLRMWWTSAVVVDLPLVPVMPTTLCGGSVGPRLGEQFDVADHRHPASRPRVGDRMAVERHARRDDDAVE